MLNTVILIGRLTRDPDQRYTPNGVAVTKFTLAVDRGFTNKQGEKETDFIDVVVWQKLAENCASYLGKGRLVAVEGRLQIRSYDDKEGIRRKVAEVVARNVKFLDKAKDGGSQNGKSGGRETEDLVKSGWGEDCPF
jgi:single-strand DNA-binding protein